MLPFIQNSAFDELSTLILYLFFTSDAASVPLSFRMFEHFCSLPLDVSVAQLLFYYYYGIHILLAVILIITYHYQMSGAVFSGQI